MNRLDCETVRESVDLYLDGELDGVGMVEFEDHLGRCGACRDRLESRRETKERLRSLSGSLAAPSSLKSRLREGVRARASHERRRARRRLVVRGAVGGGVALGLALGILVLSDGAGESSEEARGEVAGMTAVGSPVIAQAVAWHRREIPVEVTGPVADTVRAWFDGKLPYEVDVPEIGREGNLLGARLSHIDAQPSAHIVYEVDGRKLTVMVFDAREFPLPGWASATDGLLIDNSSGYNVVMVQRGGLGYTFTSDVSEERLRSIVYRGLAIR